MRRRVTAAALCLLHGVVGGCGQPATPAVVAIDSAEPPPAAPSAPPASSEAKLLAMREAVRAGRGGTATAYLKDADATVRRGAVLAVGPDAAVGPDELFGCLHDSDAEVRELAGLALRSRGLSGNQVSFARQFSHPDPAERLAILNDLADGAVANPGPWLARLAEDPVPAVRLGAARVATQLELKAPWIAALARADGDPTVREWAGYYQGKRGDLERTGHAE